MRELHFDVSSLVLIPSHFSAMVSSLRSTTKVKSPKSRLPVPWPVLVFVVTWILSWLSTRTRSSTLYDPRLSSRYSPIPQPTVGPPISSSIIIPAYRERANLRPLAQRVFESVARPEKTELVIVDDASEDGTEQECAQLKDEGYNVELLVRRGEKGLSSAVLRGFEVARGSKLVVMDADLQVCFRLLELRYIRCPVLTNGVPAQHPPEMLQPMLDSLSPSTPIALGTRYGKGVSMSKGWPLYRRIISWGARSLARPLTSASDPMTGFFAIMKEEVSLWLGSALVRFC